MIQELFLSILEVTLGVSVVIVVLLLALPLLRRYFSARARCAVWVLLAVRLLLPFNLSLPSAPIVLQGPETVSQSADWRAVLPGLAQSDGTSALPRPGGEPVGEPSGQAGDDAPDAPSAATALSWQQMLIAVWLTGAAGLFTVRLACGVRLRRSIRRWARPVERAGTLDCYRAALTAAGVEHGPRLLYCPCVGTPMLAGWFRQSLLLPRLDYAPEQFEMIFAHELAHRRRGDLFWQLLLTLAACVHWFNPLIHLLARQARRDIELACDDEVVRGTDEGYRRRYCEMMLDSASGRKPPYSLATTRFSDGKQTLRERFRNIFDTRRKRQGLWIGLAVVLTAVLVCALFACRPGEAASPSDSATGAPPPAGPSDGASGLDSSSTAANGPHDDLAQALCEALEQGDVQAFNTLAANQAGNTDGMQEYDALRTADVRQASWEWDDALEQYRVRVDFADPGQLPYAEGETAFLAEFGRRPFGLDENDIGLTSFMPEALVQMDEELRASGVTETLSLLAYIYGDKSFADWDDWVDKTAGGKHWLTKAVLVAVERLMLAGEKREPLEYTVEEAQAAALKYFGIEHFDATDTEWWNAERGRYISAGADDGYLIMAFAGCTMADAQTAELEVITYTDWLQFIPEAVYTYTQTRNEDGSWCVRSGKKTSPVEAIEIAPPVQDEAEQKQLWNDAVAFVDAYGEDRTGLGAALYERLAQAGAPVFNNGVRNGLLANGLGLPDFIHRSAAGQYTLYQTDDQGVYARTFLRDEAGGLFMTWKSKTTDGVLTEQTMALNGLSLQNGLLLVQGGADADFVRVTPLNAASAAAYDRYLARFAGEPSGLFEIGWSVDGVMGGVNWGFVVRDLWREANGLSDEELLALIGADNCYHFDAAQSEALLERYFGLDAGTARKLLQTAYGQNSYDAQKQEYVIFARTGLEQYPRYEVWEAREGQDGLLELTIGRLNPQDGTAQEVSVLRVRTLSDGSFQYHSNTLLPEENFGV